MLIILNVTSFGTASHRWALELVTRIRVTFLLTSDMTQTRPEMTPDLTDLTKRTREYFKSNSSP